MKCRCRCCGWTGDEKDVPGKDFREDYGDVYLLYCPKCKRVDWDGYGLFEKIDEKEDKR